MPKLVFGTYAKVLVLCAAKERSQARLVNKIVQSVDSTCKLPSNAVTLLLQCSTNLPDDRSNALGSVVSAAKAANADAVKRYFAEKIVPLLDHNKRKLAVLALLDIISKDDSINADEVVDVISGATKKALGQQSRFVLPDFLAAIFLYTAAADNRIGKKAVEFLTDDYTRSFIDAQKSINFIVPHGIKDLDDGAAVYASYMAKAKEKYSTIKTLFYKESPRPFYEVFVINHIEWPVGRNEQRMVKNVTAKALTGISNFLIICGAGGIGKSMMLRHLLLDAIDDFKDFRHVPIFMSIKDYKSTGLFEFIYSRITMFKDYITEDVFESSLEDGMFLLLFDGLDEIDGEYGQHFEEQLEAFADMYPKNLFVMSSRPYQSFVSFSRFTVLNLMPFKKEQAIELIDKLEYRPDEPGFKANFRTRLEGSLSKTHRTFMENPLLLTIMLMTFDKFADIPTKMHIFYHKAFVALSEAHDATKTSYKRVFKTKLTPEAIGDYFAEFCFHTYKDSKFEFTKPEFTRYFNLLRINDKSTNTTAFAYDLCANLCLMCDEGNKYHFTHRSFQEYFCALFFSKAKDKLLLQLGRFFEDRKVRMRSDNVFNMLYDMITDKIEASIIIPYLQELFDECDEKEGYWTFLKRLYPKIRYSKGETNLQNIIEPDFFLFEFVVALINPKWSMYIDELPGNDDFLVDAFAYVWADEYSRELVRLDDIPEEYPDLHEMPEPVGWEYEFEIPDIQSERFYGDIREVLDDDEFILKSEYNAVRKYFEEIKARQQRDDDFFADSF